VDDSHHRSAPPRSRIDQQQRLTIGVQRHQHRPRRIRDERIAQPDLRRTRHRAPSRVRGRGNMHVAAMDLTERHQTCRVQPRRHTPIPPHRPGVVSIARVTERDIAVGAPKSANATRHGVRDAGQRRQERAPQGCRAGETFGTHGPVSSRAASKII
jgi:hypothetical protein